MGSADGRTLARRGPQERLAAIALPLTLVAAVIAAWEAWVRVRNVAPYVLPTPSSIAGRVADERALLLEHWLVTVREIAAGFTLALATSIVFGAAFAYSTTLRRAVLPLVVAAKTVPTIAVAPLLIIWFGYTTTPKVVITALVCFFPMTVNTVAGFMSVDAETVRLFKVLGARRRDRLLKCDLPTALPHLLTGMKISAPLSVVGAIVGEWAGSIAGLGHLILTDTGQADTERVFASIAVLSLTGILIYGAIAGVEVLLTPWRRRPQSRRICRARWQRHTTAPRAGASRALRGTRRAVTATRQPTVEVTP